MMAEEIRAYDAEHDNADYAQFSMLREIAAQLAELNAAISQRPSLYDLAQLMKAEIADNQPGDYTNER